MKILFIGDIVAKAGRETVRNLLPETIIEHSPDLVIANAENLSHGNGFTPEHINTMQEAGVDFFTTGDHVWGKKKGYERLGEEDFPVIRPENYPKDLEIPGKGYRLIQSKNGQKVLVINLLGRVFMKKDYDCPFKRVDEILEKFSTEELSAIFVDFHAEATSEKYAMQFYLDGRVSAVVGTHTHVPTADFRILEGGTAVLTDVGMSGAYDSVIGINKDVIINSFLTQMPVKHVPETSGTMVFNYVIIDIDNNTGKALNIEFNQKIIN